VQQGLAQLITLLLGHGAVLQIWQRRGASCPCVCRGSASSAALDGSRHNLFETRLRSRARPTRSGCTQSWVGTSGCHWRRAAHTQGTTGPLPAVQGHAHSNHCTRAVQSHARPARMPGHGAPLTPGGEAPVAASSLIAACGAREGGGSPSVVVGSDRLGMCAHVCSTESHDGRIHARSDVQGSQCSHCRPCRRERTRRERRERQHGDVRRRRGDCGEERSTPPGREGGCCPARRHCHCRPRLSPAVRAAGAHRVGLRASEWRRHGAAHAQGKGAGGRHNEWLWVHHMPPQCEQRVHTELA
jgi:hypothetical protein